MEESPRASGMPTEREGPVSEAMKEMAGDSAHRHAVHGGHPSLFIRILLAPFRLLARFSCSLAAVVPESLDFCEFDCPTASCDGGASDGCPYEAER